MRTSAAWGCLLRAEGQVVREVSAGVAGVGCEGGNAQTPAKHPYTPLPPHLCTSALTFFQVGHQDGDSARADHAEMIVRIVSQHGQQ